MKNFKKKRVNFFWRSFLYAFLVCVIAFGALTVFTTRQTQKEFDDINTNYMAELTTQIQQKFSSIVDLRLRTLDTIMERVPAEGFSEEGMEKFQEEAEVRGYTSLGFLRPDGSIEMIYGTPISAASPAEAVESLNTDGHVTVRGLNDEGEKVLLVGQKAEYPLEDGSESIALIVGVSTSYLSNTLYVYEENAAVYSHIIDPDGVFVVRNGEEFDHTFFDRMKSQYKTQSGGSVDEYIEGLKAAMASGEDYSMKIWRDGNPQSIYCSALKENPNWYLVMIMPSGILNSTINRMDRMRILLIVGCALVILITMFLIFRLYYRITVNQMTALEKARREAVHANQAKSQFLSSMSHDIRTPMNAIIGMTDIALKNMDDKKRLSDCLGKIRLSSKHLLGLINDVLDMSKIESGKMTLNVVPVSLRSTMDDIVNIMQPQVKAKEQFFDIFIQKILSENVQCDSVRLNQVLINLVSNAVKFTPEKGQIDIYMYQEESQLGEEYVRTHFIVKDTGMGMSKEFQAKIFETFAREDSDEVAHITGTGLGMPITKSIVDLMGGTIEIESEKGKGSTFHVTLDLKRAESPDEMIKLPDWKVLVVDDNEMLCISAVENLKEIGLETEWTTSGRQAVEMVEEHSKQEDDYQFVLIDWKMPEMDGLQTVQEIRRRVKKDVPVFLISAYDWSEIKEEADALGIQGFIAKPLFKSTLYECLKQYVQKEEEQSEKPEELIDFQGKRILLAEDIDLNWEVAYEILSVFGLDIERAINGKACVEMFEDSEIGYYDAILMDLRMPVMNGYDATIAIRQLKRKDKDLPIIAMTADAFSDDAQHCLEVGMNAHIAKPIDVKNCLLILQQYLK